MKHFLLTLCSVTVLFGGFVWYSQAQGIPGAPSQPNQNQNNNASNSGRITDTETKDGWWDCSLPGGNYCISIGKINSVSMHEYVVKSPAQSPTAVPQPARVWEVNIGTDSALVSRFYYIEAASDGGSLNTVKTGLDRLNDVANQAAERTGTVKYWQQVQKDYPLSTHAHTVEFRLETKDDLLRLFGSVKRSWLLGRGARFSVAAQ
jgi:hypothetical protein